MMNKPDDLTGLVDAIDDVSELVYVADPETHDLLYMNRAGKTALNIDSLEGLKCYKVIELQDAPCPFCTNQYLRTDETYSWETTNPVTGRHYLLKDRLIKWDGKLARLEIAFDVTDYEKEKKDLRYALDTQQVVLDCIRILYKEQDLDKALNQVLQIIGQYLSADRAYIFKIRGDKMDNTHEWCREGVVPQIDSLQGLDVSIVIPWENELQNHQCIIMKDIEEIRGEKVYDVLSPQDIQNMVIAPLEENGQINGYFGVDNPPHEKIRNIVSLLETLRYFIMITFQRHMDERRLQHLSLHDTLTGFYNRNKYILDIPEIANAGGSVGVVFLDFNGLKEINDFYGHSYGDQALKKCAEKMRAVFGNANLYRTGGDEFVIIASDQSETAFLSLVDTLRASLTEEQLPVAMGYQWQETSSNLKTLITLADQHMYEDKRRFYKDSVSSENPTRRPRNSSCIE